MSSHLEMPWQVHTHAIALKRSWLIPAGPNLLLYMHQDSVCCCTFLRHLLDQLPIAVLEVCPQANRQAMTHNFHTTHNFHNKDSFSCIAAGDQAGGEAAH